MTANSYEFIAVFILVLSTSGSITWLRWWLFTLEREEDQQDLELEQKPNLENFGAISNVPYQAPAENAVSKYLFEQSQERHQ